MNFRNSAEITINNHVDTRRAQVLPRHYVQWSVSFDPCQVANRGMENTAFDSADLERVAGQLAAGFDINEHTLVNELSAEEKSVTTGSPVRLSRVSTFIMRAKDDRYSFGYIVSSIGSHWAVVVGDGEDVFLYHLIFENRADIASDANPDSITGKVRAVMFDATLWRPEMTKGASMYYVGKTQYSTRER